MSRSPRLVAALAVVLCAVGLGVAPAQAGQTWGTPRPIGGPFGLELSLSSDGRIATWVSADPGFLAKTGAVYASAYRNARKGWTRPTPVPGAVLIETAQLSADGATLLMNAPGTGLQMSQRVSGGRWSAARTVVAGKYFVAAQMSADANTLVWQDRDGAITSAKVLVSARQADGSWGAAVQLGSSRGYEHVDGLMMLSAGGTTLAWIDSSADLRACVRGADGTWSEVALIGEFPYDKQASSLGLSADGSRLTWVDPDSTLMETHRTADGWSVPVPLATGVTVAALSADGSTLAYISDSKAYLLRWDGATWLSRTLGSATGPGLKVTDSTVVWSLGYPGLARILRTYDTGGTMRRIRLGSRHASQLTVSANGTTIAWADSDTEEVASVRRT